MNKIYNTTLATNVTMTSRQTPLEIHPLVPKQKSPKYLIFKGLSSKMYCISEFCRICINKNEELTNLHATDTDLITFYEKLKYCSSEIVSNE